jgi:GDP-L-fucose synthase
MLLAQGLAYRQQYGLNVIHLLPTNIYGPGDNFDLETSHVVAALIRKCISARQNGESTVTIWGDGTATRDFLYVKDAARAVVLATELYNNPAPINIGSGYETSIATIAEMVKHATRYAGQFIWDKSKPNGQPRRMLDVSKARTFGFSASTPLEVGLRDTALWYAKLR